MDSVPVWIWELYVLDVTVYSDSIYWGGGGAGREWGAGARP